MRIHHAFDFSEPRVGVPGTLARWGEEAPARGMASASLASILLMHHEEEFSPTRDLISLRSAPLLSLSPHPLLVVIQRSAATKDPFHYHDTRATSALRWQMWVRCLTLQE
jgi:hypothetical protein